MLCYETVAEKPPRTGDLDSNPPLGRPATSGHGVDTLIRLRLNVAHMFFARY